MSLCGGSWPLFFTQDSRLPLNSLLLGQPVPGIGFVRFFATAFAFRSTSP